MIVTNAAVSAPGDAALLGIRGCGLPDLYFRAPRLRKVGREIGSQELRTKQGGRASRSRSLQ